MNYLIGSAYVLLILLVVGVYLIRNLLLTMNKAIATYGEFVLPVLNSISADTGKSERHLDTMMKIIHEEEMQKTATAYPVTAAERARREQLDALAPEPLKGKVGKPERA